MQNQSILFHNEVYPREEILRLAMQMQYNVCNYLAINGKHCVIYLDKRQSYCDRGNLIAYVQVVDYEKLHIDDQDMWPRMYFNFERALCEIHDWLQKRGELVPENQWYILNYNDIKVGDKDDGKSEST